MREPRTAGEQIDMERMRNWVREFAGYRVPATEQRIDRWLDQFDNADRDLAARVLDVVDFLGNESITVALRQALEGLSGWHPDEGRRQGRWFFVAFSGSGGESGDSLLYRFRTANSMAGRQWRSLFPYRSELLKLRPKAHDSVVFVDDFSGTGEQACAAWDTDLRELLPYGPTTYLILVASCRRAVERIMEETEMVPLVQHELTDADDLFNDRCRRFTVKEKERVLSYCQRADPQNPKGFGESGLVVVFAHKCPNNTIPILHARRKGWEGLFRRHD